MLADPVEERSVENKWMLCLYLKLSQGMQH
jgi:hypothetical protein